MLSRCLINYTFLFAIKVLWLCWWGCGVGCLLFHVKRLSAEAVASDTGTRSHKNKLRERVYGWNNLIKKNYVIKIVPIESCFLPLFKRRVKNALNCKRTCSFPMHLNQLLPAIKINLCFSTMNEQKKSYSYLMSFRTSNLIFLNH